MKKNFDVYIQYQGMSTSQGSNETLSHGSTYSGHYSSQQGHNDFSLRITDIFRLSYGLYRHYQTIGLIKYSNITALIYRLVASVTNKNCIRQAQKEQNMQQIDYRHLIDLIIDLKF